MNVLGKKCHSNWETWIRGNRRTFEYHKKAHFHANPISAKFRISTIPREGIFWDLMMSQWAIANKMSEKGSRSKPKWRLISSPKYQTFWMSKQKIQIILTMTIVSMMKIIIKTEILEFSKHKIKSKMGTAKSKCINIKPSKAKSPSRTQPKRLPLNNKQIRPLFKRGQR